MSLDRLKLIFENVKNCGSWSLQLLRITHSKRDGVTNYRARQISLTPDGRLDDFVSEISKKYLNEGKGILKLGFSVRPYDGTAERLTIYKLNMHNQFIENEYRNFLEVIANPDVESDVKNYNSAYLIKGQLFIMDKEIPVKFISMQKPIITLQHKYLQMKDSYSEISDNVLSLRLTVDVVVIGEDIYLFTFAGENLFNMPRAYKEVCHKAVLLIQAADIVSSFNSFQTVAEFGHNPRKFITFNENNLQFLSNTNTRKKIANRFNIPMIDGRFDTTIKGIPEKIIKILCGKAVLNPFDNEPCEVTGSIKKWLQ